MTPSRREESVLSTAPCFTEKGKFICAQENRTGPLERKLVLGYFVVLISLIYVYLSENVKRTNLYSLSGPYGNMHHYL
jgi:hypothetical protein